MDHVIKKGMKAIRGDISALLLIAFIFQLLTPIVVLAGTPNGDAAFETELRASICRVYIDEDNGPSQNRSQTDGFVCEFCVLCSVDASSALNSLPEFVSQKLLPGAPPSLWRYDQESASSFLASRSRTPRAPPKI